MAVYDQIGVGYVRNRQPDPHWEKAISAALAGAGSVVNIGAGTGSYELGHNVVAVEPSLAMIGQRPGEAAPVVCARAEALPFRDGQFDAAMAVLTTHHWSDVAFGLSEMQRVASRQVVVTWDPKVFASDFWLLRDYLPEIGEHDAALPTLQPVCDALPQSRVEILPVPHDCLDGFLGAFWRRPQAYLEPEVRASMSGFALIDQNVVDSAMASLRADLRSGRWSERNVDLLDSDALDLGYRLVMSETPSRAAA